MCSHQNFIHFYSYNGEHTRPQQETEGGTGWKNQAKGKKRCCMRCLSYLLRPTLFSLDLFLDLQQPVDYTKSPKIKDPILRKYWDASKSASANLQSMGILYQPNSLAETNESKKSNNNKEATKAIFDVRTEPKRKRIPLNKADQEYIASCFVKHGDDYTAMFRDIKDVNRMQHTDQKLRKMGNQFLSLNERDRQVAVPENVQHLVSIDRFEDEHW
jgi:hypothetical protein